jgi:HD-GYP domain-containing protein (c-di-GMP phosphodiesterase class II)
MGVRGLHFVQMKNRLNLYWALVTASAIVFCAILDWSPLSELTRADWVGWGTFVVLGVLSQYLAIESTLGAAQPVKSSIAFVPLLTVAVVMPTPAVVLAVGVIAAIDEIFFRERNVGRSLFNTSQTALSYGLASLLFQSFGNGFLSGDGSLLDLFLRFYALSLTVFSTNVILVSIGVALRQDERLSIVLSHAVGKGGGNFLSDILASPLALLAAYLYELLHAGGLLLLVLPLMFVRKLYEQGVGLQQANDDLLKVLVKAIETRDPYTSGHSDRVMNLSKMIGVDFGLRPTTLKHVEHAALLHDIGKIDVQFAQIISKPSDLTDEERTLIQSHATAGADLLETLTSVHKEVIVGVRHHHERYDGTGYPSGLKGKEIPIAARIIMIADSVDAMLSDRPYRNALSISDVESELRQCSGTQFDPDLVSAILSNRTLERAETLVERAGANRRLAAAALVS